MSHVACTGCVQNNESGFPWLARTFVCAFSRTLRDILIIEQVRFSYNTEYVTQFITILNNRSNWVWRWTMITYIKAENMYTGQKCGNNIWFIFHDFPGPRPNSMTFKAWEIWILNSMTCHDFAGSVHTMSIRSAENHATINHRVAQLAISAPCTLWMWRVHNNLYSWAERTVKELQQQITTYSGLLSTLFSTCSITDLIRGALVRNLP